MDSGSGFVACVFLVCGSHVRFIFVSVSIYLNEILTINKVLD